MGQSKHSPFEGCDLSDDPYKTMTQSCASYVSHKVCVIIHKWHDQNQVNNFSWLVMIQELHWIHSCMDSTMQTWLSVAYCKRHSSKDEWFSGRIVYVGLYFLKSRDEWLVYIDLLNQNIQRMNWGAKSNCSETVNKTVICVSPYTSGMLILHT